MLQPRLLRPQLLADSETVCLRCLRRLSKLPHSSRRRITTTGPARQSAISVRSQRNAFRKEYFWPNGILQDVLGKEGIRGGVQLATSTNDSVNGVRTTASTARLPHISIAGSSSSTISSEELAKEELPHRRRKRLRESAVQENTPDPTIPPDASSRLSTLSSSLPVDSWRRNLSTLLSLSKPRLTFLVVLTTTTAYSLYPVPALLSPAITDTPSLSPWTLLFLTTGTFLCSASANSLNMLFEPQHDAKMSRTRNRPLVRGLISTRNAYIFAALSAVLGVGALYYGTTPTTAALGALNIFIYAGMYTPLKRVHVVNTWVGAIVGGIPPLMGWTAAGGQCASAGHDDWRELLFGAGSAGGWCLAALLFAWQFPHFNALSHAIRFEYRDAGYKMLCWTNPARNARVAVRYSILMFPVCYALAATGTVSWAFVPLSAGVNAWMTWEAVKFWRYEGARGSARGLFWASVWHLPGVLVLAMFLKTGLWERVWRSVTGKEWDDNGDAEWEDEEDEVAS
ncbi:mitochondria protoheme IX farnesyltransferase [Aulographum hederae CBS 113979]|uniref:Protoheme IX farnesyltransferase, mitochondrial n=1 Tax=Aulographum hederae CBS 113979 TaxID=1176131 RepID=A0A6G1HBP5_9PEZI|nr:mitochondria protoheme IX farnesyltransferase [Aulographum hederae CBS 113979]